MLTATFVIVLSIIYFVYIYFYRKPSSLLPGPWNLPILGYLHKLDPKSPYLTLTKLAQKYGPVYKINMGLMETVVISDARILKKVLLKDEALGRPPLYLFDVTFKRKGIICAPVDLWKDQRKFVSNFLRTSGAAKISPKRKLLENVIKEYAEEFMQSLNSHGDVVTIDPSESLGNYVISVASDLFLGKSSNHGNKVRKILSESYDQVSKLLAFGGPLNFIPFLRFLPQFTQSVSSLVKSVKNIHDIQSGYIKSTETSFRNNAGDLPSNLIEAFLQQKSKCDSNEIYNQEQLQFLLFDVFGASIETTTHSLLWILLYLAKYPKVQEKLRDELTSTLRNKSPEMEDLPNLPYTEATIAEVARIRTVVPLGFVHYASEDIQVEDIKIPKGHMIMPLLWAIHMDSKSWKEPENFSPDRFLDDEGKFLQMEGFLPFQSGKKMCVGEELGQMMVFLFVSTVLKNFRIEKCSSTPVDLSSVCGVTLIPKPQELIFKKI